MKSHVRRAGLDGEDADAIACDAAMAPFVTGEVDPAALDDLGRLCVQLDRLRHHAARVGTKDTSGSGPDADGQGTPAPDTTRAWEAIEQAIIGKTTIFLPHS